MAEGQRVTHTKLGTGTIVGAKLDADARPQVRLLVRFPGDGDKTFKGEAFTDTRFFSDMQLPPSVPGLEQARERLEEEQRHQEKLRRQREKERESAEEFAKLKGKYWVRGYPSDSPSDPLYPILLRIDEGEPLQEDEVSRLESNYVYAALATNMENEYRRTLEAWPLVKASRYWRRAKEPEKAVKATEHLLEKGLASGTRAAVLTTRGGALRDLGDLDAAEQCAREAINGDQTSYYPYNLLGAILWQRGEAEEGHECFTRAENLGAPPWDQERKEERALEEAGPQHRKAVAKYLLEKDQSKYRWAEYYLQER